MGIKFNNKKVNITINDEDILLHYRRPTKKDTKELENTLRKLEKEEQERKKVRKKIILLKGKKEKLDEKILEIEVDNEVKAELEGGKISFLEDKVYKNLTTKRTSLENLIKRLENDNEDKSISDAFFRGHLQKIIPDKDEFKKLDKIASEYTGVYLVLIKEINKAVEEENEKK